MDVLLVSLGSTAGLRRADDALAGALERAGASVAVARASPPGERRTFALTDLVWARAARRAARAALYSSMGAALLWPRPGAIRYDALMADNRPGRHGVWQRPVERRRLAAAPALIPWAADLRHPEAIVVPPPVDPSGRPGGPDDRDIAAITYGANPEKKGLDLVLAAWSAARRPDEELVVAGIEPRPSVEGVRWVGSLPAADYRALLRRARVYLTAPRREDFGIAQLEALADGCMLVTAPSRATSRPRCAPRSTTPLPATPTTPHICSSPTRRRSSTGSSPTACCPLCSAARPRRRGPACAAARTRSTATCSRHLPGQATPGARSPRPSARSRAC